ncbi:MAG: SAM-dependent methyltransferase [Thermoplasmata archaeon]|nr:MAG: SAM-dependent methyltransferase [Thermoplasmata archaeon]
MDYVNPFDLWAEEYDRWYDENEWAFLSEVEAIKQFLKSGRCIEIGAGTGRFSLALDVDYAVEPSEAMAKIAKKRGVNVIVGRGECLPFEDESFDNVLLIFVLCFVEDPLSLIKESYRVLKTGGRLIIGIIDKNSPLGREYEQKKVSSKFYRHARFYSAEEVISILRKCGMKIIGTRQTIFCSPNKLRGVDRIEDGHGRGLFAVICAEK